MERTMTSSCLTGGVLAAMVLAASVGHAEIPDGIAAKGEFLVATFHAQGAQIYECKADTSGKLTWQFREPIASLFIDGKTVGRHFAGPNWELDDGSAVLGKVAARAPGATPNDIPLLKLEAKPQRESGLLASATTIQRLNTRGGVAQGACDTAGALRSVPYSADYAFYRKSRFSLLPYTIQSEPRRDAAARKLSLRHLHNVEKGDR
jgi:hypothetical protein